MEVLIANHKIPFPCWKRVVTLRPSALRSFSFKYPIRGYWDDVLFVLMVVARQFGDVKHYLHQPTVSC